MKREDWIWMPHPGHYICAERCLFRLNTYVGEYIVSTVGELQIKPEDEQYLDIGRGIKYETMVFKAVKTAHGCCPYEADISEEREVQRYNAPEDAYKGHLELCEKWSQS
jgi:hypothetical protein